MLRRCGATDVSWEAGGSAAVLLLFGTMPAVAATTPAAIATVNEVERLTLLVLTPDRPPTVVVPKLERPDAERAVGAPAVTMVDWLDGEDPYRPFVS